MAERSAPDSVDAAPADLAPEMESLREYLIDDSLPLACVEINSLVLLKIIKHCQDFHAEGDFESDRARDATGLLLGLATEDTKTASATLEVQNCFGFPPQLGEKDSTTFSTTMLHYLRDVNVDNNNIGFFQSGNLSTTLNDFALVRDILLSYQMQLKNHVVCIVYDPAAAGYGQLAVKAFHLSPAFMEAVRAGKRNRDGGLGAAAAAFAAEGKEIIEEVPIKIKDLSLSKALVWDLKEKSMGTCDSLMLSVNPYMRQGLGLLSGTVEDAKEYQKRMLQYGRDLRTQQKDRQEWRQQRRQKNQLLKKQGRTLLPTRDPSLQIFKEVQFPVSQRDGDDTRDGRLQVYLSGKRVTKTCKQLDEYAGSSFDKLYLASGFHSKQ